MHNPHSLGCMTSYPRWRERKLAHVARSVNDLIVEIKNLNALTAIEHAALLERCRRNNMAIYASQARNVSVDMVQQLGLQFGLHGLDANWLADESGITHITVNAQSEPRGSYIPYTNRTIKWHTDGYYNTPDRQIRSMILHCVNSAARGGENRLLDHEIAYLMLRDSNIDFINALSAPDAMTIPERTDEDGIARAAQTGPVFSFDTVTGCLHMRYTARTRSIQWKQDAATLAAVAALEKLLASDMPYIFRTQLEPGMGLLCNNVLHDRAGFNDKPGEPRLLYRARYYERIAQS
jgi:hypothetical protein